MFRISEVTDMEMKVDYSKGPDVGEFKKGIVKREFFVIYEGPPMSYNKEQFLDKLQKWMDKQ